MLQADAVDDVAVGLRFAVVAGAVDAVEAVDDQDLGRGRGGQRCRGDNTGAE